MKITSIFFIGLGLATTFALPSFAQGRAPAVLPVTELSIEEYKVVKPEDAKSPGYDFSSKGTAKVLIPVEKTPAFSKVETTPESALVSSALEKQAMMNLRSLSVYLILMMMSMPALAWLYMSRKSQNSEFPQSPDHETAPAAVADLSNVTNLSTRQTSKEQNKEDDLKKAS